MRKMKASKLQNLNVIKHQWDFIIKLPWHPLKIAIEKTQRAESYLQSHLSALSIFYVFPNSAAQKEWSVE